MLAEHSIVVLTRDVPEKGLYVGDCGTIVHVYEEGAAYEIEVVDGDGSTIALMTLDAKEVRPISRGELLHTRRHESGKATG